MSVNVPVLLYHSVNDRPGPAERPYAVSRSSFAAHADAVRASGRRAVTISSLAAALRSGLPLGARALSLGQTLYRILHWPPRAWHTAP